MNTWCSKNMFAIEIFTLWPPIRVVPIYLASLLLLGLASQVFARGTANGVPISTAADSQFIPTIISDGAGGAIIVWEDWRGGDPDIYAQCIDSAGVVQWTADGVAISIAPNDQCSPAIASDGSGGAIIAWSDLRGGNPDIYAQRIDSTGAVQWTADGVAISTAVESQDYPIIVSDGSGGAIITWKDRRPANIDLDIYAQCIDSIGVAQWTADGVAISTLVNDQEVHAILSDGAGGAMIVWEDDRRGEDTTDIYAQRIDSAGVVQWATDGVAISTAPDFQEEPSTCSDDSGGAIITWQDLRGGTWDIYAQRIDANGVVQWTTDGVAIITSANDQDTPDMVSDGSGGAIITWVDRRSYSEDIYAQRIDANGVIQWAPGGVAISAALSSQEEQRIVSDGYGGAIITWQDLRGGTWDIYAQRVDANGTVQWPSAGVENAGLATPGLCRLYQNFPNPFSYSTTIKFGLPRRSQVSLGIYDISGSFMESLIDEELEAGYHVVSSSFEDLVAGIYFYKIEAGDFSETRKMILVK